MVMEGNTVRLLAAQARVTPSSSKESKLRDSTPQAKLHFMLYLTRLVTSLLARLPYKPTYIFLVTDSECIISVVKAEDKILQSWFTNQVEEIMDHIDNWSRKQIGVEAIHHWPGLTNIADLATKGKATVADIGENSTWQCGPKETSYLHDRWLAFCEFKRGLAEAEIRLKQRAHCNAA